MCGVCGVCGDDVRGQRHFVDRAEAELGPSAAPKPAHVGRVKHFFCEPMEVRPLALMNRLCLAAWLCQRGG